VNKIKVMPIVGTRPEIIKLSEVMKELDRHVNLIFIRKTLFMPVLKKAENCVPV
jgi:UDP-N-acetylglucosamine 2-epimerase